MSSPTTNRLFCTNCNTFVHPDDIADGEIEDTKLTVLFLCPFCSEFAVHWKGREEEYD